MITFTGVNLRGAQAQPGMSCSVCHEFGHYKTTCPLRGATETAKPAVPPQLSDWECTTVVAKQNKSSAAVEDVPCEVVVSYKHLEKAFVAARSALAAALKCKAAAHAAANLNASHDASIAQFAKAEARTHQQWDQAQRNLAEQKKIAQRQHAEQMGRIAKKRKQFEETHAYATAKRTMAEAQRSDNDAREAYDKAIAELAEARAAHVKLLTTLIPDPPVGAA